MFCMILIDETSKKLKACLTHILGLKNNSDSRSCTYEFSNCNWISHDLVTSISRLLVNNRLAGYFITLLDYLKQYNLEICLFVLF